MNINYFFNPKSIAVIGASRKQGEIGNSIFRNFLNKKFKHRIYAVNPYADEILGHKCHDSVKYIPDKVDLAVIAVPAKAVKRVMLDCAEKKVKAVVIITSGFSEIGNTELEQEIREIAIKSGIRIIGPNCLGIFDSNSLVDTLFLPAEKMNRPRRGKISFISQSGAVGSIVLDWMSSRGYGVAKFVSYGNAVDVDECDLLEYLARDKETKVICMYLEGIKDGRRFMHTAKIVSRIKPVIVLKGGRTSEGAKAASSHTGSLAGNDAIYDAAFKQSGVIRAKHLIEMFNFARTLAEQPLPDGKNIGIITNGGGFGVLATDQVIMKKLKLAEFSAKSIKELKDIVPSYGKIHNPLDLVGDADDERYKKALDVLGNDDNVDAILCILLFQTVPITGKVVDYVIRFANKRKKPIIVCSAGGYYTQKMIKTLEENDIPVFDTPARAIDSMDALVDYANIKRNKNWTYE